MIDTDLATLFREMDEDVELLEESFAASVKESAKAVHESLLSKTPVYEGRTVRNYVWQENTPYSGPELPPLGTGDPGPTNSMALGTEPRRSENEAASRATFKSLNFLDNPYKKYIVQNNSSAVQGLENGELPGKGKPSRSPKGMFGITELEIRSKLKSGLIK